MYVSNVTIMKRRKGVRAGIITREDEIRKLHDPFLREIILKAIKKLKLERTITP